MLSNYCTGAAPQHDITALLAPSVLMFLIFNLYL